MAGILQGLVLMVIGMGIVYLFLILLVYVLSLTAKIIPKFNYVLPDEEPKKKPRAASPAAGDDAAIAIAIAAATTR